MAICFVKDLRRDKMQREAWEREQAERRQRERDEHAKREFYRRMNPRTKEDFDLLYHALESTLATSGAGARARARAC